VIEVVDGDLRHMWIKPGDFGIPSASPESIKGGDPVENARIIRDVLEGKGGPHRDAVLINATFAIRAAGLRPDLPECLRLAADAVDSGRALERLERLRELSKP
jgi:anthranilate phosphoribosyltransferase